MSRALAVFLSTILLVLPLVVAGQPPEEIPTGITTLEEALTLLETIGNWLFSFLLVGAAVAMVVAAYMFITAGGSAEQVTSARKWVMYALAGVGVAVLSKGLVTLVKTFLAPTT